MNYMHILLNLRNKKLINKFTFILFKLIGVEIPNSVVIGKNVRLVHWANGLVIHPNTIIEDDVKIYQNVTIGRADIWRDFEKSSFKQIIIKKGAVICAGAKILCKEGTLIIGENSIVGANAVIMTSTGDNEIWAGVPARKIGIRID